MNVPEDIAGTDRSVVKSYVREMLELNPMWQSAEILRRRREILSTAAQTIASNSGSIPTGTTTVPTELDPQQSARLQQRARRSLQVIQEQFYQLPDDQLASHLRVIQSEHLPQYSSIAARLTEVAKHRVKLLNIQSQIDDPKFVYSLLQSLIAPAAEAAALREQYIEAIISERRVKQACESAHRFSQNHPEIAAFQQDWFDLLIDRKNQQLWNSQYSKIGQARNALNPIGRSTGIGLVIAISLISLIVRLREDTRSPRKKAVPVITQPINPPPSTFPNQPSVPSFSPDSSVESPSIPSHDPMINTNPFDYGSQSAQEAIEKARRQREKMFQEHQERMRRIQEGNSPMLNPDLQSPIFMETIEPNFPSFTPPNIPENPFEMARP